MRRPSSGCQTCVSVLKVRLCRCSPKALIDCKRVSDISSRTLSGRYQLMETMFRSLFVLSSLPRATVRIHFLFVYSVVGVGASY